MVSPKSQFLRKFRFQLGLFCDTNLYFITCSISKLVFDDFDRILREILPNFSENPGEFLLCETDLNYSAGYVRSVQGQEYIFDSGSYVKFLRKIVQYSIKVTLVFLM